MDESVPQSALPPADNSTANQPTWSYVAVGDAMIKILDERGFCIALISGPAVLHDYEKKLGVDHWSRKPGESFRQYPNEEQVANVRLMSLSLDMLKILQAASHGFRSYQYGNASTKLAAEMADLIDTLIAKAEGRL